MKAKAVLLAVGIVLFSLTGYIFFTGNPVSRFESKEIVTEYLRSNYPEHSFTITHVGYYPGVGTYIVSFVSKDKTVKGTIDVRDGKIIEDGVNLIPAE